MTGGDLSHYSFAEAGRLRGAEAAALIHMSADRPGGGGGEAIGDCCIAVKRERDPRQSRLVFLLKFRSLRPGGGRYCSVNLGKVMRFHERLSRCLTRLALPDMR